MYIHLAIVLLLHQIVYILQGVRCVTASNGYMPEVNPVCPCEKGERGEKGYPGVCTIDCGYRYNIYTRDCLSSRINVERLALSIRQLITDTKIVYQRARANSCVCQTTSSPSVVSNPYHFDYQIYARLKGDKGDAGQSCPLNCMQSTQTSVRVFPTKEAAIEKLSTYSDHTYVHIVDEFGYLQNVFVRVQGRLIPIVLGNTEPSSVHDQNLPAKKSQCTIPLPCPTLHIFALGPYARKMCSPKRPTMCSKLSEYDDLCARVSKRHQLKGFYRAFISTSTQWLANLFDGVCLDAKIMNMQEQVLFDSFEDIFEQKPLQHDILDVQGLKPQFQYWWHGSLPNGTASSDTCNSLQYLFLSGHLPMIYTYI
ncbi:unnamed protein product [Adineta ricciae]|uniref:Uncharacterized protein n=1 Tax=Adineta ricciae TaxID=249248 RepID=A0A814B1B3_ADIRI|nr:unnamed protein product [Adineta ricciae]